MNINLRAIEHNRYRDKYKIHTLDTYQLCICIIPPVQAKKITINNIPKTEFPIAVYVSDTLKLQHIIDKITSNVSKNFIPICGNANGKIKIGDNETKLSRIEIAEFNNKKFNCINEDYLYNEQINRTNLFPSTFQEPTISTYLASQYINNRLWKFKRLPITVSLKSQIVSLFESLMNYHIIDNFSINNDETNHIYNRIDISYQIHNFNFSIRLN